MDKTWQTVWRQEEREEKKGGIITKLYHEGTEWARVLVEYPDGTWSLKRVGTDCKPKFWIDLSAKGKTLIEIDKGESQEELAEAFIRVLGEPEIITNIIDSQESDDLWLVFPHQNLPEEMREVAERMTTSTLLSSLGFQDRRD